jgi:hypothetical protein
MESQLISVSQSGSQQETDGTFELKWLKEGLINWLFTKGGQSKPHKG